MHRFILIALAAGILGALAVPGLAQTNYKCVQACMDRGRLYPECMVRCTNGGVPLPAPQTPAGQPASAYPSGQPATPYPYGQPATSYPAGQPASSSPSGQPGAPSGQTTATQPPAHSTFSFFPTAKPTPPGPRVDNTCVIRCLDHHLNQYCQQFCVIRPAPGSTASQVPAPAQ